MPTLAYQIVDVFTDRPFGGNPLAVVLDADGLAAGALQAIASEFHLSETVFPMAPDGAAVASPWPSDRYAARIFTPATELPFAGHPSIGAAWVLQRLGRVRPGPLVQQCGVGDVALDVDAGGGTLTGAARSLGPPVADASVEALARAVGLTGDDVVRTERVAPRRAGAGLPFTYLPVRPGALARARPDDAAVRAVAARDGGIVLVDWGVGFRDAAAGVAGVPGAAGTPSEVHAAGVRVFCAPVGVTEDPATGSAALGLGVWAAASGLLGEGSHAVRLAQGGEMGRPSRLDLGVLVEAGEAVDVRVRGAVVPVAVGEITVPSIG